MRQGAQEVAAIVLAEEVRRRAAGPDHMAFGAVTWRDLGHAMNAVERVVERSTDHPLDVARRILLPRSFCTTILAAFGSGREAAAESR